MVHVEDTRADIPTSLNFPVGVFSPLWLAFAGAAATGAAYFWMTRWARPTNLQAEMSVPAPPPAPVAALVEAVETEAVETEIEAAPLPAAPVEPVLLAEPVEPAFAPEAESLAEPTPLVEESPAAEILPEPAAPEIVAQAEAVMDDLTRLVGIGPKLAASLAERGVTRFAQVAAWTPADLAEIDQALALKGRAVRDAWVAQAKRFAESAA